MSDRDYDRGGGAVSLMAFLLGLALAVVLAVALFWVLNDRGAPDVNVNLPGASAPASGGR